MHRTATGLSRINIGVVDLSGEGRSVNTEFADAVRVLMDAGFHLTNKARYDDALHNMMDGYDSANPDVTLVCRGDIAGSSLEYATIFMSAPEAGGRLHIHTALPKETTQDQLDALSHRFDCLFSQDRNGTHVGYITLEPGASEPGVKPYESALSDLRALQVKTVPLPFSPHGLTWLPFWLRSGLPHDGQSVQRDQIASTLMEHMGAHVDVVDIPQSLKDRLARTFTPQDDPSPSLTPRRSR